MPDFFADDKMSVLHTDNKAALIDFQSELRTPKARPKIPGEHRPKPSPTCLRFDPPNTQILRSRLCGDARSITDGVASAP